MVVTGIGISPDPTKELLVWEFSADMDPTHCCCWFLQDDFPVFRKEQMNHKSGTCGSKFSTSLWIAASSCLLSSLAFPNWRHPFCTGESVCDSLSNSLHNVFSDQTHSSGGPDASSLCPLGTQTAGEDSRAAPITVGTVIHALI